MKKYIKKIEISRKKGKVRTNQLTIEMENLTYRDIGFLERAIGEWYKAFKQYDNNWDNECSLISHAEPVKQLRDALRKEIEQKINAGQAQNFGFDIYHPPIIYPNNSHISSKTSLTVLKNPGNISNEN